MGCLWSVLKIQKYCKFDKYNKLTRRSLIVNLLFCIICFFVFLLLFFFYLPTIYLNLVIILLLLLLLLQVFLRSQVGESSKGRTLAAWLIVVGNWNLSLHFNIIVIIIIVCSTSYFDCSHYRHFKHDFYHFEF